MKKIYEKLSEKLGKKKLMILIITVVLAVVLLISGVIWLVGSNKGSKEPAVVLVDKNTEYELEEGEEIQLSAKASNGEAVKWVSSNTEIVSVDSKGFVKAQKEGEATITAKVGDDTVTIRIKVVKGNSLISAYSIHVVDEINLMLGDEVTLTPILKYGANEVEDAKFQFKSQDDAVVAITNEGVIHGKKEGLVNIEVGCQTPDGEDIMKLVSINVTPDLEYSIDFPEKEVVVGEQFTLNPSVYNNTQKTFVKNAEWNYKSSDESVATVDKTGRVTAKKAGDVQITAFYKKGSITCDLVVWTKYISTTEDFSEIYKDLGGRYKLTADVTTTDGATTGKEIFTGILDGGGHTLTKEGGRIFSSVQGDAIIRNMKLISKKNGPWGGSIADNISGNALVENVTVHCDIYELRAFSNKTDYFQRPNAGMFNYGLGGTIRDCTVYITIEDEIETKYEGKTFSVNQISAICQQGSGAAAVVVDNCKAYSNHPDVQFAIGVTPINSSGTVDEIPQ